jgi:hypothetical protein
MTSYIVVRMDIGEWYICVPMTVQRDQTSLAPPTFLAHLPSQPPSPAAHAHPPCKPPLGPPLPSSKQLTGVATRSRQPTQKVTFADVSGGNNSPAWRPGPAKPTQPTQKVTFADVSVATTHRRGDPVPLGRGLCPFRRCRRHVYLARAPCVPSPPARPPAALPACPF